MPKNLVLDSQILTTLMACPRKCDLRFNEDLVGRTGKSNSLECGSLVHCITEFTNKAVIAGKSRSEAILQGFEAGQEYIKGYSDYNKYVKDKDHLGMVNTPEESGNVDGKELIGWKFVIETMTQYFDYWKNDAHIVIAAEEVRRKVIYEDSDIRIAWAAKFDAILEMSHGLLSRDYKTMKQRRMTDSKNNQFIGQCVLLGARSVQIDKIGFQKSLKPAQKFERVTISYSADRLAEWVNDILPYYANMMVAYDEAKNFPPNFTQCESKYGLCEYSDICNDDRSLRSETIKLNFVKSKKWDITNVAED